MGCTVQQRIDEESPSLKSPPFSIVDFTGRQSIDVVAMSYNEDEGSEESFPSKTNTENHALLYRGSMKQDL